MNETSTLVSVVIPIYNQVDYIAKTVESVIEQTYDRLEIILADDASSDGTQEIIKDIASKDKRIKLLISRENKGISKNFNTAFDACTGDYIAFLGGDDRMHADKIEKQLRFLESKPDYVLCMHDMEHYDLNTESIIRLHSDMGLPPQNPLHWVFYTDWTLRKRQNGILPSACLARAEYFLYARYDERLHYKHELLFTLDNYMNNPKGKWGYIPEVLGKYGIHNNNFSMTPENTNRILEETHLLCAITESRYPSLKRVSDNHLNYFYFKHLIFDWFPENERSYREKIFLRNTWWGKFFYYLIYRLLKRIKRVLRESASDFS